MSVWQCVSLANSPWFCTPYPQNFSWQACLSVCVCVVVCMCVSRSISLFSDALSIPQLGPDYSDSSQHNKIPSASWTRIAPTWQEPHEPVSGSVFFTCRSDTHMDVKSGIVSFSSASSKRRTLSIDPLIVNVAGNAQERTIPSMSGLGLPWIFSSPRCPPPSANNLQLCALVVQPKGPQWFAWLQWSHALAEWAGNVPEVGGWTQKQCGLSWLKLKLFHHRIWVPCLQVCFMCFVAELHFEAGAEISCQVVSWDPCWPRASIDLSLSCCGSRSWIDCDDLTHRSSVFLPYTVYSDLQKRIVGEKWNKTKKD